jgi:hypothetical protein
MKRFDPISHHQNGPGWSFDHSAIKECDDGDYVRVEDFQRAVDLLTECFNFDPCYRGMQCGIRDRVQDFLKEAGAEP